MEQALKYLVRQYSVESLNVIGFSGRAILAVLLASCASESLPIDKVVSIAGNLTVASWVNYHDYLPLDQSLDAQSVCRLKQNHLILLGENDANVPAALYLSQPHLMAEHTQLKLIQGYAHLLLARSGRRD